MIREFIPIDEAMEERFEDGKYVGREEGREEGIVSLSKNGVDVESISKLMGLDLSYVKSVLLKKGFIA
jgi:predicted transposase YdaD